jgi:hypothetical protein
MVSRSGADLYPFRANLALLVLSHRQQLRAIRLHPSPQATYPDVTLPNPLEYLNTLGIRQQAA